MDKLKENILDSIIGDLSDNYRSEDYNSLKILLDDVITNAFFISNRIENKSNLQLLSLEIKECIKSIYLQRGTEDVNSLTTSGKSSVFVDAIEKLRNNIIHNGKRVIF